jgi:hypothetical protein
MHDLLATTRMALAGLGAVRVGYKAAQSISGRLLWRQTPLVLFPLATNQ